jgi:hypothetical protein
VVSAMGHFAGFGCGDVAVGGHGAAAAGRDWRMEVWCRSSAAVDLLI